MRSRLAMSPPTALLLLLVSTWIVYAPGLHGSFLFDDFANLPALGATGPVDNWPTFWRYITSGTADPTGRPLTLLTFLLDAHDWPARPHHFKLTNLILHLLNGALLALLLRQLGQMFRDIDTRRINFAATLGAGIWMLHPLFVSTTLYIVQREAMLPATFILTGLLLWLHGRRLLESGPILPGLMLVTLGLGGCTVLAVLSKANGILLPALALAIEYAFLRPASCTDASVPEKLAHSSAGGESSRVYTWALRVLGWLPATMVATYLLHRGWNGLVHGISSLRPWTLGQRLLTEPRVLMDYLDLLWLPRPFTPGLFNDQIKASTSLWSPLTTLPALLAVIGLIICAWFLRRRWPAAALAILFFFVGQLLESSTVALELYFEHRNYLPAILMFWPLALWLCGVRQSPVHQKIVSSSGVEKPADYVVLKAVLAVIVILGLAAMTHARADLWGNSHDQAILWATLNPDSPRAQANVAAAEMNAGDPAHAAARLHTALAREPAQVQLALNLFAAQCQMGHVGAATLEASALALQTTRDPGTLLISWFGRAIDQAGHPPCPELTLPALVRLLDAGLANPLFASNPGRRQDLYYLRGKIALTQGNANAALLDFNRALDQQVRISAALKQAALLGSAGYPDHGLAHLDHYEAKHAYTNRPRFGMPRIHAWVLEHQKYMANEFAQLRSTLLADEQTRKYQHTP